MGTREEGLEQLRQAGFVNVKKWMGFSHEYREHQLLAVVLRKDLRVTKLE